MALSANIVFEVRTAGSDSNGGGFNSGASGTDRSQQNAAHATLTTSSTVHTTTTQINVAVGDYTVTTGDVGNLVQVTGGTATAGFYEITAVDTGNNRWTVDRSVGTAAQTVAGAMGGALASLGKVGGSGYVTGTKVWVKAGTYSVTSASTNVTNGCFSAGSNGIFIEGYNATRGDLGTRPLIQASGISTFTLISISNNNAHQVTNLKLDGASLTSSRGIVVRHRAYRIEVVNCTNGACVGDLGSTIYLECTASGCSSQIAFDECNCHTCVAYDNTVTGFAGTQGLWYVNCISDSNSGASSDGFASSSGTALNAHWVNCVAYNNGRDGFRFSAARGGIFVNCIAEDNAGWGFNGVNVNGNTLINCAGYSNTSGESTFGSGVNNNNYNFVTGGGSFFTNAASQNFALNNTGGAGAAARAAGAPGAFPVIGTTGYLDIGAAQHQDTGGGGGGEVSHVFG